MKRVVKTLIAVSVLLAPMAMAQGTIRIGNWGPQSGPAAAWGAVTTAIEAYFDYINDQGGIGGQMLELVTRDDGYDPARTVAAVREMIDREDVFAFVGGVGTANGLAALPLIKRAGTPWVGPATGAVEFADQSDGIIYATFTNYFVESALMTRYAIEELDAGTVAIFYQNDGYGLSGVAGMADELSNHPDVLEGDQVTYERGTTNMGVQALRLQGSGADTVLMFSDPSAAASLLNEFQSIGYHPQMLASVTLLDPSLLAHPLMQGAMFSTFLRLPSVLVGEGNGDPIADQYFRDIIVAYAPEIATDPFRALGGIAFAEPLVIAMQSVVDSGEELTQENVAAALGNISAFDTGLYHNLDFTAGDFQGNNSALLLQMTPQGLRPVSDWLTY